MQNRFQKTDQIFWLATLLEHVNNKILRCIYLNLENQELTNPTLHYKSKASPKSFLVLRKITLPKISPNLPVVFQVTSHRILGTSEGFGDRCFFSSGYLPTTNGG